MLLMLTNIQKNAGTEVPSLANAAREMSRFVERAGRICSGKRWESLGNTRETDGVCLTLLSPRFSSLFASRRPRHRFFVVLLSLYLLLLSRFQPIFALLLTFCANFIFIPPIDSFVLNFCSQPPCLSLSHSDPLKMATFHSPFNSFRYCVNSRTA